MAHDVELTMPAGERVSLAFESREHVPVFSDWLMHLKVGPQDLSECCENLLQAVVEPH